jgi:predicted amidophosphoribosyltransferase
MESRLRKLVVVSVIDAMFPRFCVSCEAEGSLWCDRCDFAWNLKPQEPSCGFCDRPGNSRTCVNCARFVFLDGLSAYAPYGNPTVRRAIHAWKYTGDRTIEPVIRRWLFSSAVRMEPPLLPFYCAGIPLHVKRRRVRGFDQARTVAHWAGQMYGLPVLDLLVRTYHTPAQARSARLDRRLGELDGVFLIHKDFAVDGVPDHVLLCDDVFTSGATMDSAAQVLKNAGVKTVWGFVLARGSVR